MGCKGSGRRPGGGVARRLHPAESPTCRAMGPGPGARRSPADASAGDGEGGRVAVGWGAVRGAGALGYRRALVRTAAEAVAAGWPVVPGAWWSAADRRFVCELPGCTRSGPHPTGLGALYRAEDVPAYWRRRPYTVLVPTGEACDVVDVPTSRGRGLALRLDAAGLLGPVVSAGGRMSFLTAPGGAIPPGRASAVEGRDVLVHGKGSWIMLPPSPGPGGEAARWLVRPSRCGWVLPERELVLGLLGPPAVPAPRRHAVPSGVPAAASRTVPA